MSNEHWLPVGWSYPNRDAAQGELEALRAAGVRCKLQELGIDGSESMTLDEEPISGHYCIRVLFEQRELAEQILNDCKQQHILTTPENLCENCKQQSPNVHLTIFDEHGKQLQRNLCQDCYQQSDLP